MLVNTKVRSYMYVSRPEFELVESLNLSNKTSKTGRGEDGRATQRTLVAGEQAQRTCVYLNWTPRRAAPFFAGTAVNKKGLDKTTRYTNQNR